MFIIEIGVLEHLEDKIRTLSNDAVFFNLNKYQKLSNLEFKTFIITK